MKISQALKPRSWGSADRSAAATVVGFLSLGWTSSSTAEQMAADRAEAAIVGVLTPIRKIYSVTIAKLRSVF
jgi:hypothetical protein